MAEGLAHRKKRRPQLRPAVSPWLLGPEISGDSTIQVRVGQAVNVQYNTPSFNGYPVHYQYRLAGGSWKAAPTTGNLVLEALPVGKHQLDIRAQQAGGYQWSDPTSVFLVVSALWYTTTLFQMAILGGFLLVILFVFKWYQARYRRRIAELETALKQQQKQGR